jgi:hypothetical protein
VVEYPEKNVLERISQGRHSHERRPSRCEVTDERFWANTRIQLKAIPAVANACDATRGSAGPLRSISVQIRDHDFGASAGVHGQLGECACGNQRAARQNGETAAKQFSL